MDLLWLPIGLLIVVAVASSIYAWLQRKQQETLAELAGWKNRHDTLESELAAKRAELEEQLRQSRILIEEKGRLAAQQEGLLERIEQQKEAQRLLQETLEQQRGSEEVLRRQYQQLAEEKSRLAVQKEGLDEKLATQKEELTRLQAETKLQFEQLASKILEEKSARFTESNKANIEALLKPLGESLSGFRQRVEETFTEETKQRSSLEEQVKQLIAQTNQVSADANELANALKGQNKTMGNWGEMVLESILQHSGLELGREYSKQESHRDEETGERRVPDILVQLPDQRTIVIDSKVSLVAYNTYCHAETPEQQRVALTEHLRSMRAHVDNLSSKRYDDLTTTLDFTMLFVPIEPAYILAVQHDPGLWEYAYGKRIMFISPTNLIACLKLISDLWRREQQSKNAQEIINTAERMYEKFVGLTKNMEDLGRLIERTQEGYNTAMGQLTTGRGNLINQATKLKKLGLKSGKSISPALLGGEEEEPAE